MNKVLVVIDMQEDFTRGVLGTREAVSIIPNVMSKIKNYGYDNIIFTKDLHYDDYLETEEGRNLPIKHCIINTKGSEIIQELKDVANRSIVSVKNTFASVNLGEILKKFNERKKIDEVELIGLCTDICVISNAFLIKAFLPNAHIKVDSSCCAGSTIDAHNTALKALCMCQIEVI